MTARLVTPSREYAGSFVEALREGLADPWTEEEIRQILNDFDGWYANAHDLSKPIVMSDGRIIERVPYSMFWLVDGGHFIGQLFIRHSMNDFFFNHGGQIGYSIRATERRKGYGHLILSLAKEQLKKLALPKALISCRDDNQGSIRIIEAAGGVLENKVPLEDGKGFQRRYWLDIET